TAAPAPTTERAVIRCRVARRFADEAQERELALEQRFLLDEHTARCTPCARHERRVRALQELLEPAGEPPPCDVERGVVAVAAALAPAPERARRPARGRGELAALLAALAASALLAWPLLGPVRRAAPEPVPDATTEAAATPAGPTAGDVERDVGAA